MRSLTNLFCLLTRSYSELSRKAICVVMHDRNPWTLEKWHVRLALRNLGVMVESDDSLSFKAVKGPSPDLHGKELCVRLKVNQLEDIRLRLVVFQTSEREADGDEGDEDDMPLEDILSKEERNICLSLCTLSHSNLIC